MRGEWWEVSGLSKQLLPNPQHGDCTGNAKHEVGEKALAKQLDVQQMADECSYITANDAYDEVHATSFSLTAHNAVGNVADENTYEYWPSGKYCNVF